MARSMRIWLFAGLILLLFLALLFPQEAVLFAGAAAGWALVALFGFRSRERMNYQKAVRHMRRGEYPQAIKVMDELINTETDALDHRLYRANLHLLDRDLSQAETDYQWVIAHHPTLSDGYIGLAEIAMQRGDYPQAREHASVALERDSGGWVAAYNLGLIEERLGNSEAMIGHLQTALSSGLPDRFQLLARMWLARHYHRLGRDDDAAQQIALLREKKKELHEWQVILDSEQGAVLRSLFAEDVRMAQQLIQIDAALAPFDK